MAKNPTALNSAIAAAEEVLAERRRLSTLADDLAAKLRDAEKVRKAAMEKLDAAEAEILLINGPAPAALSRTVEEARTAFDAADRDVRRFQAAIRGIPVKRAEGAEKIEAAHAAVQDECGAARERIMAEIDADLEAAAELVVKALSRAHVVGFAFAHHLTQKVCIPSSSDPVRPFIEREFFRVSGKAGRFSEAWSEDAGAKALAEKVGPLFRVEDRLATEMRRIEQDREAIRRRESEERREAMWAAMPLHGGAA